jgi:hypothetical protein
MTDLTIVTSICMLGVYMALELAEWTSISSWKTIFRAFCEIINDLNWPCWQLKIHFSDLSALLWKSS